MNRLGSQANMAMMDLDYANISVLLKLDFDLTKHFEKCLSNKQPQYFIYWTAISSGTMLTHIWETEREQDVVSSRISKIPLFVSDLGWTREETIETYFRLSSFKEDWEAPGMEAYDEL